ncbi:DUF1120 domain-containing protein [Escherichia coli]|uniref:DUF1120 domain-containing protein n=1 Tax=Escherichia coli TaxID=562 RepID=UPI0005A6009A|nr:DUF1120 domain-containing protein [Escherichia coli]EIH0337284.1 DUF1120 domain-containing protein [Escherichia coli O22]EEU9148495.1 DUF1120 domain-containing protein [Escherichia coli]EEU9477842.1 DUF1120 domain-containing protein [Escherichia coli]EEW2132930.1 DUF1120 domain-containing protein [Escherichia coli]EFH3104368.1 DUF1120 domain-containing protein [Escherichia coli]
MNKISLIGLITLFCSTNVSAADITIHVSALVEPPSCSINLTNSVINLGTYIVANMNTQDATRLPDQNTQLSISCPGSAAPGILIKDLNSGTAMAAKIPLGSALTQSDLLGLGLFKNKPVGAWAIMIDNMGITVDNGTGVSVLSATDSSNPTWIKSTGNWQIVSPDNTTVYAFGTSSPQNLTTLTVPLKISSAINAMSELNVTDKMEFSGTAEITLKYY